MAERFLLGFEDTQTDLKDIGNYTAGGGYEAARKVVTTMDPAEGLAKSYS